MSIKQNKIYVKNNTAYLKPPPQLIPFNNWTTGYFNSNNGYTYGAELEGLPTTAPVEERWQTNDPYDPETDKGSTSTLVWISNLTLGSIGSNNQSLLWGGFDIMTYLPGIVNPVLYRQFTTPSDQETVTWSADFRIDSNGGSDIFGFDLRNATNTSSLAKIQLNPATTIVGDLLVEWIRNGTVQTGGAYTGMELYYGTLYRITATLTGSAFDLSIAVLTVNTSGGNVNSYTAGSPINVVSGGSLSDSLSVANFGTVALTWELDSNDPEAPGDNYMILNITSVEKV